MVGPDVWETCRELIPVGSVFAFLAEQRGELFPTEMFADTYPSTNGRPSMPPQILLPQSHCRPCTSCRTSRRPGTAVRPAMEGRMRPRPQRPGVRPVAAGLLPSSTCPFSPPEPQFRRRPRRPPVCWTASTAGLWTPPCWTTRSPPTPAANGTTSERRLVPVPGFASRFRSSAERTPGCARNACASKLPSSTTSAGNLTGSGHPKAPGEPDHRAGIPLCSDAEIAQNLKIAST